MNTNGRIIRHADLTKSQHRARGLVPRKDQFSTQGRTGADVGQTKPGNLLPDRDRSSNKGSIYYTRGKSVMKKEEDRKHIYRNWSQKWLELTDINITLTNTRKKDGKVFKLGYILSSNYK